MNETIVTLTRLGRQRRRRSATPAARRVATFRVASTPRRRKGDEWVDGTTTWFTVNAWRRLADHVTRVAAEGDPVIVHGRLEADVWAREDGTSSTQLVVDRDLGGHDLARGTSLFTKPGRREDQPSGGDPWDRRRARARGRGGHGDRRDPRAGAGFGRAGRGRRRGRLSRGRDREERSRPVRAVRGAPAGCPAGCRAP